MSETDLQALLSVVVQWISAWGLKVVGAIILLVVGRVAAGWSRKLVRTLLDRAEVDDTLVPFFASLAYYLVLVFVIIAVLGMVGVQTASMVAVLGAAGLAVGLALQGTLSNVASGVLLLVFRPFGVDDYVEAAGTAGTVKAIGLFATTLTTPDNVEIVVPNAQVHGAIIKNYAANDTRRNDLVIGISYDDDIGVAVRTIEDILDADARVLADPAPVVAVGELGDSSVNLVVRPWCKREDYWDLRWDLLRTAKERLEAAGCSIPYPQRDVHVHQASVPEA